MRKCVWCRTSRTEQHKAGCPNRAKSRCGRKLSIRRFQCGKTDAMLFGYGSPQKSSSSYRLGFKVAKRIRFERLQRGTLLRY